MSTIRAVLSGNLIALCKVFQNLTQPGLKIVKNLTSVIFSGFSPFRTGRKARNGKLNGKHGSVFSE